ncbi:Epoxide hydrolase 4 [Gonapodya sp. JEL0774]|nr:Epoxide hydrolase 4 [Gonapodya sp. JEL0774]
MIYRGAVVGAFTGWGKKVSPKDLLMSEERKRAAEFRLLEDETVGKHRYIPIKAGLKLHIVEAGDKKSPLMILLHGFPQNWTIWRPVMPTLSRTHRVVALDMRGYGGSDAPKDVAAYNLNHLTADVKELAEILQVEVGNDKDTKFVLGGHDWGALVVWDFAPRYQHVLSRMIIVNVPPPTAFERNMTLRQMIKSWYVVWFQFPGVADKALTANDAIGIENLVKDIRNITQEDADVYRYAMTREGRMTAAIDFYRANLNGGVGQLFPRPPKLDVTTLVVWGENDVALDMQTCLYGIEDYVPNVTVEILKGVGHFVPDEEPAKLAELVEKFLSIA